VLQYLARYTHRVAISNRRLLSLDNGRVTFQNKNYAHGHRVPAGGKVQWGVIQGGASDDCRARKVRKGTFKRFKPNPLFVPVKVLAMVDNVFRLPGEYRQLLRRYFRSFYHPLARGERKAETQAQQHFVGVCTGHLPPQTVHEFAYTTFLKYCSLSGTSEEEAAAQDFTFPAPQPAPRPPEEPITPPSPGYSGEFCPRCARKGIRSPLLWRHARDPSLPGEFLGCSRFPACQYKEK